VSELLLEPSSSRKFEHLRVLGATRPLPTRDDDQPEGAVTVLRPGYRSLGTNRPSVRVHVQGDCVHDHRDEARLKMVQVSPGRGEQKMNVGGCALSGSGSWPEEDYETPKKGVRGGDYEDNFRDLR